MIPAARQIPLDLGHRAALGRDDFLVAPSNQDAVAWIDSWPDWPAPALIIHGPAASGKTHLAAVWSEKTGAARIAPGDLGTQSARALAERAAHLAIDLADTWIGDHEAETALFHLYNLFKEERRTILLTMRVAPSRLDFALADLASRLRAAPAAAIQPPDDVLLEAILVKLFADRQISLGSDVLAYLLPRMDRSFSAARDMVEAADRLALAEKKPVTVPLIRRVLLQMESEKSLPLFAGAD